MMPSENDAIKERCQRTQYHTWKFCRYVSELNELYALYYLRVATADYEPPFCQTLGRCLASGILHPVPRTVLCKSLDMSHLSQEYHAYWQLPTSLSRDFWLQIWSRGEKKVVVTRFSLNVFAFCGSLDISHCFRYGSCFPALRITAMPTTCSSVIGWTVAQRDDRMRMPPEWESGAYCHFFSSIQGDSELVRRWWFVAIPTC